ncbi:MAG: hypothetical protein K2Q18_16585, partial [Bdellovibrionales bacterium]|nr:hypothetical protein [Bdellovibrionales bacterium]
NASLNFHTYDSAVSATGSTPSQQQYERKLKLRERPRRDEKDTAFWGGALKTNKEGITKFSFIMPDSLTRWRVQGRAFDSEGFTGSRKDFIYSEKAYYIKWNGPKNFRVGDEATTPLTVYNMTESEKNVTLKLEGTIFDKKEISLKLSPGQNIVNINLKGNKFELAKLSLWEGKSSIDQLEINYVVKPVGWSSLQTVKWQAGSTVPANSIPYMLTISQGSGDAFFRATDYLVDYPYGCVEQTSSRLLPLALAYNGVKHFGQSLAVQEKIENVLLQERARLVQLAGPNAQFSWWGSLTEASAFVTIYAYYSDFIASRALELKLPKEHWENALKIYASNSSSESLHQKALEVWMIGQMGLPIKTLTEGILKEIAGLSTLKIVDPMSVGNIDVEMATIYLISKAIAKDAGLTFSAALEQKISNLLKNKSVFDAPIVGSLILLNKNELTSVDIDRSNEILNNLVQENTTIQRALTLAFLYKKLGTKFSSVSLANNFNPGKNWSKSQNDLSRNRWYWNGQPKDAVDVTIPGNYSAHLIVEQNSLKKSSLPVTIKRNFYKLTKAGEEDGFDASLVTDDKLDSTSIYLDEVILSPSGKLNYGIVQIPLPPGASMEKSSWGTQVRLNGNAIVIDEKGAQEGVDYYSAAIPRLHQEVKSYQLIRFSTKGRFTIPGVKFFKMYAPEQQAYSFGDSVSGQKITIN